MVFSHRLCSPPFNIDKADLDVSCYIPTDNFLVDVIPYPLYLGAHYTDENIYLSVKFHRDYINIGIDFYCIPYEFQPYIKSIIEVSDGSINNFRSPWSGAHCALSKKDDFRVITVRFPRKDDWGHSSNKMTEYYFYVDIRFLQSESEFPLMIAKYGGLDTESWFAKIAIPQLL